MNSPLVLLRIWTVLVGVLLIVFLRPASGEPPHTSGLVNSPADPQQHLERTCIQTNSSYNDAINLRSDVVLVYGVDPEIGKRVESWRKRGYLVHGMTGLAWGSYRDYLDGTFDGQKHEDEGQVRQDGTPLLHNPLTPYMCPSEEFAQFLFQRVKKSLDAGVLAMHFEEPEFWAQAGYSEGFKREWKKYYGTDWVPPHASENAQWQASKLKYHLYRKLAQQLFSQVQDYNRSHGTAVRCYLATHSLLNYAHWRIVSPESSLTTVKGFDGFIAQIWTGTARTPNVYRGVRKERTFETAFLEYGAMQNLVRATGLRAWYLADPVEDDPNHDWNDYRDNWKLTVVASLFQPEIWRYEVAPWPERIFKGEYTASRDSSAKTKIPPEYATVLQTVMNTLNEMNQPHFQWDCGTTGVGLLIGDSLMFQRAGPHPSHPDLSAVYGLALPPLKRGLPIIPVQLENVTIDHYLDNFRVLLLTYQGMKPLSPAVHEALAKWVKAGGVLIFYDDDSDPYNRVTEWWNTGTERFDTPRQHLFQTLNAGKAIPNETFPIDRGALVWIRDNPIALTLDTKSEEKLIATLRAAVRHTGGEWRETNYLLIRRGPYLIAAGLDESPVSPGKIVQGSFIDLFDPELKGLNQVSIGPGSCLFLLDLDSLQGEEPRVLASACKALLIAGSKNELNLSVEGAANTKAVMLIRAPVLPKSVKLDGGDVTDIRFDSEKKLLRLFFDNKPSPRLLNIQF